MTKAPGRFWIIQHPSSGGDVVAKFDTQGDTIIPDEVVNHGDFVVVEVADRSTLAGKTINQSNLSQKELDLLSQVYPVQ